MRQRQNVLQWLRLTTIGLAFALLLLVMNSSLAHADFVATTISGSQIAVAGQPHSVYVTVWRSDASPAWASTEYSWNGGIDWICVSPLEPVAPGDNGNNAPMRSLTVDAPASPGTYTLNVRPYEGVDCAGAVGAASSVEINVLTITPNPDLPLACGIDVIVVLDESYSIYSTPAVQGVRTAANAFLDGMLNRGSQAAIVEFSSQGRHAFTYTQVNDTQLPVLQAYVNGDPGAPQGGYEPGSSIGTNWDDALAKVELENNSAVAPLVVFITDGDPTTYGANGDANISGSKNYPVDDRRLLDAISSSADVKLQGSHLLVVGVGVGLSSSASQERLSAISGHDVHWGGDLDLTTTDVMLVSEFDDLTAALQKVTLSMCQSSLTINKLLDRGDLAGYQPAEGWRFSASARYPQPDGLNFAWSQPYSAPAASVVSSTTGVDGALTFQWEPIDSGGFATIAVTETLQAGYTYEGATCEDATTSAAIAITQTGSSFVLSDIALDAAVICEVRNKIVALPAIILDKSTQVEIFSDAGEAITYTYVLTNSGNVPLFPPYTVTDDKTTATCPAIPATLNLGESVLCTGVYITTEADVEAEFVTNVAQGRAKDRGGADVISNQDQVTVPYFTETTNDDETEQPAQPGSIFLPSVRTQE